VEIKSNKVFGKTVYRVKNANEVSTVL